MEQHLPTETELVIPRRFCGPARSGNGGYAAGALAALAIGEVDGAAGPWPATTVTLRRPPPLDTAMSVTDVDGACVATHDGEVVARAVLADHEPAPVRAVTAAEARVAEASYAGLTTHAFPTCFACGPGREPGDGLRIFPGPAGEVDGVPLVAATWTPHPSVAEDWHHYVDDVARAALPVTWASLDCVGGWAGDLTERSMVLGTMTAAVDRLPVIGAQHVVVGSRRGAQGRKTFTSATLLDPDGRAIARAEHVWIAIDPSAFN